MELSIYSLIKADVYRELEFSYRRLLTTKDCSMNYKYFGNTDLEVSEMGFGCSRLGGTLTHMNDKEVTGLLLKAFDNGINFYDTADSYGQGNSEKIIGKVFKDKRNSIIIATKAGYCLSSIVDFATQIKPLLRGLVRLSPSVKRSIQRTPFTQARQNFSPVYLTKSIERSLKRLQTYYIDLFQLHSPPTHILETGEIFETLEILKSQGKIRYYGVSCRTVEDALLCLRYPGISSIQVGINLLEQGAITKLLPFTKKTNIAIIARQPFASGFLAKNLREVNNELYPQEEFEDKIKKVERFQFLAKEGVCTMAQAALRFVLQLDGVSVVIPGMSNQKHLEENLATLAMSSLTKEELAIITSVTTYYKLKYQGKLP